MKPNDLIWMSKGSAQNKTALHASSPKPAKEFLTKENLVVGKTYQMAGLQGSEYQLVSNDGYEVNVVRLRDQKPFTMKTGLFVTMINKPESIM